MMEDPLTFFDEEHFSAVDFIDAIFTNTSPNAANLNNNSGLAMFLKNLTGVLQNLQLSANELQLGLNSSINSLVRAGSVLGSSEAKIMGVYDNGKVEDQEENNGEDEDDDDADHEDQVTRLQYYVDSVLNLVHDLKQESEDVVKAYRTVKKGAEDLDLPVNTLVSLRTVQSRLNQVFKLFETAKFIATISLNSESEEKDGDKTGDALAPTSGEDGLTKSEEDSTLVVTPDVFRNSLEILEDILVEQLAVNKLVVNGATSRKALEAVDLANKDIIAKIDSLVKLKDFFKGLRLYDSAYSNFVNKMAKEQKVFISVIENKKQEMNEATKTKVATVYEPSTTTIGKEVKTEASTPPPPPPPEKKMTIKEETAATATGFGGFMNFFGKNL